MSDFTDVDFVRESNRIEGILRDPTEAEVSEHIRFSRLHELTIEELERFVSVYQPDARLRAHNGLNVRVGNHFPPMGGPAIPLALQEILDEANRTNVISSPHDNYAAAYRLHFAYETLHPFTDGNGRSGRALWHWIMPVSPLGFLHHWYYQSLQFGRATPSVEEDQQTREGTS